MASPESLLLTYAGGKSMEGGKCSHEGVMDNI